MTLPHLLFLIGLPGSGKSTLAASLIQKDARRCLVSTDQIRSQLFGDAAIQGDWSLIWQELQQQLKAAAQITATCGTEAIYDATNAVRRDRKQALQLARDCGFTYITGIWVNPPLALCLERNRNRDRQVPEAIILRMHTRLSAAPPALEDGFDALKVIE
jgi:predicted kinase